MLKVKICGLKYPENIGAIAALGPDYMGFIFWPGSKRYIGNILSVLQDIDFRPQSKAVAVFVDQSETEIARLAHEAGINSVQLHGSESPELCSNLRLAGFEVIKAIPAGSADSLKYASDKFAESVDLFLLDTPAPEFGGSGNQFNHEILHGLQMSKPYLLGGGMNAEAVSGLDTALMPGLFGIDASSKLETSPGFKSTEFCRAFITATRQKQEAVL